MKRVLIKEKKEAKELVQRRSLFRIMCKSKGQCCKVIIDCGSTNKEIEMVEKFILKKIIHPHPYKVSWLQKGHQVLVNEQCKEDFQIGSKYKDEIVCDVMPMYVFYVLLGIPWKYDRKSIHDDRRNVYRKSIHRDKR